MWFDMFAIPQTKIKNVNCHPGDSSESEIGRLICFGTKPKLDESVLKVRKPQIKSVAVNVLFSISVPSFFIVLYWQVIISEEAGGFHLKLAQNQTSLLWTQSEVRSTRH